MRSLVAVVLFSVLLHADEGMWTFNNFPSAKVQQKYGFSPTKEWLDHVRLSSVRLAEGCSSSFVSARGLLLTNHHCAAPCIQEISSAEHNYTATGFNSGSPAGEVRCPQQEANVLTEIADVTARVAAATKGLSDQKAGEARKAEIARIEKECATNESLRCDVVPLYGGGIYNVYKYHRYQDVRLVFAPEFAAAFFGGDPDNFMFPRYDLDMAFLRVYDKGQPLATKDYLKWSAAGPKEGDLTFVSGHPGNTSREYTVDMLAAERDQLLPSRLMYFSEYRGMLAEYQTRGAEQARTAQEELFGVENSLKAYRGQFESLLEKPFFDQKRAAEADFQRRVQADPKLRAAYGSVWNDIAAAVRTRRAQLFPYRFWEGGYGLRSDLFDHARTLVRFAAESAKPNDQRLPGYTDARRPELEQGLLGGAPIAPELEIEKLTFSLTKMREVLGPDDPNVRALFGKQSAREIATGAVKGSRLQDPAARKALYEGGAAAIAASKDSMIELARKTDPVARAVRKRWEDEVEAPLARAREKLGTARFAVYGTSIYPDATFTLRLSYGSVKGWMENGKAVPPFTNLDGAFERNTGADPFALPKSWLDKRAQLNPRTPFNFVTTNDIIGGNSGSPVINKDAELVGLIFDGNIHSLGGNYGFDENLNRAVAVDTSAIVEALRVIYGANALLAEIGVK